MAYGFEDWTNPPNGGNANNVNPQLIGWQQPGGLGFFLNAMNSYNKVDPNSRYMNISYGGDSGSVLGIAIKLLNARNKFKAENNTLKNYLDALTEMTGRNKQNRLGALGIDTGGGGGQSKETSTEKARATYDRQVARAREASSNGSGTGQTDAGGAAISKGAPSSGGGSRGGEAASGRADWGNLPHLGGDPRFSGQPKTADAKTGITPTAEWNAAVQASSGQNALAQELGYTENPGASTAGDDGFEYASDPETNEVTRKKKGGDSEGGE